MLPARGRLSLWVGIMSSLLKALKFAREKPAGCSFAFALSLAMMCAVAAGALWLFFAFAPHFIQNRLQDLKKSKKSKKLAYFQKIIYNSAIIINKKT